MTSIADKVGYSRADEPQTREALAIFYSIENSKLPSLDRNQFERLVGPDGNIDYSVAAEVYSVFKGDDYLDQWQQMFGLPGHG